MGSWTCTWSHPCLSRPPRDLLTTVSPPSPLRAMALAPSTRPPISKAGRHTYNLALHRKSENILQPHWNKDKSQPGFIMEVLVLLLIFKEMRAEGNSVFRALSTGFQPVRADHYLWWGSLPSGGKDTWNFACQCLHPVGGTRVPRRAPGQRDNPCKSGTGSMAQVHKAPSQAWVNRCGSDVELGQGFPPLQRTSWLAWGVPQRVDVRKGGGFPPHTTWP